MTREEAIETLKNHKPNDISNAYKVGEAICMAIEALSAEPCEDCISRKAHWQNNACSNCGIYNASAYKNWCPNCGAKMESEE